MRVGFPVYDDRGLNSRVNEHFGQAGCFVVVDMDSMEVSSLVNEEVGQHHGQCQPVSLLAGASIDALVVGGIGGGAIMKLTAQGTRVFQAAAGSVRENVELLGAGKLSELSLDAACAGHGPGMGGRGMGGGGGRGMGGGGGRGMGGGGGRGMGGS